MRDQQKETFREEARELLAELEDALLELEDNPEEGEVVAKVFRAMHTIKGSGAMFGFDAIAAFTHEVETVFDQVRNGRIRVTRELVDLSLAARDHVRVLLDDGDVLPSDRARGQDLVSAFRALLPAEEPAGASGATATCKVAEEEASPQRTCRLRLRLPQDIIGRGTRPDALLAELAELGTCCMVAQTEEVPPLDEIDPQACFVYWDMVLTTDRGINAIHDVFIFVEDEIDLRIDVIDDADGLEADPDYKRLGEILIERGDLSRETLTESLACQKRLGQMLAEADKVHPARIEAALQEQQRVREMRRQRQSQETAASIRVPAERLDFLVNMVGELVTAQARLSQVAAVRNDADLLEVAEEVERLTAELRDSSLSLRMLPIGTTFAKFKRLVRDLAQELGKEIELQTEGAETELDKTVIEKLNDPLVHLIRNSIDHGIELPAARLDAGKPATGSVCLTAEHSGDSVVIEIRDDGRGLDREAIMARGAEKGLVAADAQLSNEEVFDLIFVPGFSTAQNVTSVSGRGVGMDVVKRAIEALRGTISIQSIPGCGTTISIRIPLTLAIVESLLVKVAGEPFVLPLAAVEECVELTRQDTERTHGRNLANVRGSWVPYIPLRQRFAIPGESPPVQQIVITRVGGQQIGFVVDHVVGEHQTVIKSLGRFYRDLKGISGATILGDGAVALILDLPQLYHQAELNEIAAGAVAPTSTGGERRP